MFNPRLTVSAADTAMVSDIAVRCEGARAGAGVELSCAYVDGAGVEWRSRIAGVCGEDGAFDTARDPAAGSYHGVDVGGLFWSARPPGAEDFKAYAEAARTGRAPLAPTFDPLAAAHYTLAGVVDGAPVGPISLVRRRLPVGVRVEDVRAGAARGIAFHPAGPPLGAVLLIGGSEGGAPLERAAQLAGAGFATLAIGYFAYPDRPDAAFDLPIEDFAEALSWLRRRTNARAAVWGSSRGAEAAVLLAHHRPDLVDALVAWVPPPVAHPGLDPYGRDFRDETRAMWTWGGAPVAYAQFGPRAEARERARAAALLVLPGWRAAPDYADLWSRADVLERCALPVEGVRGPVLLVSGGDDGLWPAAVGAAHLARRLAARGVPVRHLNYPGAGHAIGVPNEAQPFVALRAWRDGYFGVEDGLIDVGGDPAGAARAARSSWREAVAFLSDALR